MDALEDPELEQAVEYDLLTVGLRLRWLCDGTDRLNWRDLMVMLRESGRDAAITRHAHGEFVEWGVGEHLLAGIFDTLQGANYQRSGGKGPKPKPIPRPGEGASDSQLAPKSEDGGQLFVKDGFEMDAVSIDEMNEWLGLKPVPS